MGARLARYTDNDTYAEVAERTWDWIWGVNYINHNDWRVYDGGTIDYNCTDLHKQTFSYNFAVLLQGCAYMYNYVSVLLQRWNWRLPGNTTCAYYLTDRRGKVGRAHP